MNPNECCGSCDWSTTNEPQFCELNVGVGIGMNGGWAQYCVAPLNKVKVIVKLIFSLFILPV